MMASLLGSVALVLALGALTPGEPLPLRTPYAAPGQGATGQVVSEANNELQLNTTPCAATQSIITFRKPYTQEPAGSVSCNGSERTLVQAVQN
jgi:hypothetical protein